MRFQCSSCQLVISIDEAECACTIGCSKCGEIIQSPDNRFGSSAVFGDYVIDTQIRQGADGTDYSAHHLETAQPVSIKIMNSEYAADAAFRTRFISAARQLASLDHPNLMAIFTAGLEEQILFMARQLVDGEPLADRLARDGTIQPGIGEKILVQTSMALEYAWERAQLLHTNIKPDVILLEKSGAVKLSDVGLVQLTRHSEDEIKGTPQFMPPEVIVGEEVDLRTDFYNLACVVFYAVTGQFPYAGDSPRAILEGHLNDPIPSASAIHPSISENFDRTLQLLMGKEPDDRLGSAGEIKRSLAGERFDKAPAPKPMTKATAEQSAETTMAAAGKKKSGGGRRFQKKGATRMVKAMGGDTTMASADPTAVAGTTSTAMRRTGRTTRTSSNPDDRMAAAMAAAPKRSMAPFIVLAVIILGLGITGMVLYKNYVPNSLAKFEGIYLGRFAPMKERGDYPKVRMYLNKAAINSSDRSYLESAADALDKFAKAHPNSIYCLPADRIDYKTIFGMPDFLMKKHKIFAPQVAGSVPRNLAEYDEFIARLRRKDLHEIELDAVEEHREKVAKVRRAEEIQRQQEEKAQRELEIKQDRLAQLLERKQALIGQVLEATKGHDYDHAISLVRPLQNETDPMFAEIRQWAMDKSQSIAVAQLAYQKIFDSGLTLRGEKIVLPHQGKLRKVEVRTFTRGVLTAKYKELSEVKEGPDKGKIMNQTFTIELPTLKVPRKELEVLGRLAIEKSSLKGDFFGYLGIYYYYAGQAQVARRFLGQSSAQGVSFVLDELAGGDDGSGGF